MAKLCNDKKLCCEKIQIFHGEPQTVKCGGKVIFNFCLTMFITLSLFGCFSNPQSSPSYVIIAIDQFGSGTVSCPEYLEKAEGGFFILCNDFVRLANAYTTSLQSPAAIGSLLTGEYPINHGLRHADSSLSFAFPLLSQSLLKQGYKTAFFSEGDPVKSYQGLNRGFENFYDFSLSSDEQSVFEVFTAAEKFILKSNQPKFSIIYLSALRNAKSYEAKVDVIEEQIEKFFNKLKAKEKWHNTYILVVGLQGELKPTFENPWPVVDLSENHIKVEAFIKPATKPRDKEHSFQIDENISLADLGRTLLDWAGIDTSTTNQKRIVPELTTTKSYKDWLSYQSEKKLVQKRTKNINNAFLIESSWSDWRYGYAPIYLILDDQYRVFLNKELQIYNTLLNREISINVDDQIPNERLRFYLNTASMLNSDGEDQFKDLEIQKLNLGYQIWGLEEYKYPDVLQDLEVLKKEDESNEEILGWMAKLAVMNSDCKTLLKLSKVKKNKRWKLAASSCLGIKTKLQNEYRNGCLRVFFKNLKTWSNQCQNDLLYHSWKYINFDHSEAQTSNLKNLMNLHQSKEQKIKNNWKTFLSSSISSEVSIEPTDFDLYYLQLSKDQKNLIDLTKPQL